jgi:hypothetical protein
LAALRICGGILLIMAGAGVLAFFFRPRMLKKMMRASSRTYRESAARRDLGDVTYGYSVFPRVMGALWLGPVVIATVLAGLGISLLS